MRNYVAYAVVFGLLACSSSAVLLVAQESPRTIPCLIARLRSPDFTIDDQEIVIALNLWIAQSRVGPEIPQPISDADDDRDYRLVGARGGLSRKLNHGKH
jgi:hypothetical protein